MATKRRRLDVHIDFQFKKAPAPMDDSSDSVLDDIEKFIRDRLTNWPIAIREISWDRKDDEAGERFFPDGLTDE